MCELLVFMGERASADPYLDCKLFKRGDVLAVQGDGWPWGKEELAHADFRVVRLPNVTVSQAAHFLDAEIDVNPKEPSRMLKPRSKQFDINHASLPSGLAAGLGDHARHSRKITASMSHDQLAAVSVNKAVTPDPNVIS